MKKTFLLLFLFLFSLTSQGQLSWQVTTGLADLNFSTKDNYNIVEIEDCSYPGEQGSPQLPYKIISFVLPYEAVISGISITNSQKVQLSGTYNIWPVQPLSIPDGSPIPDFVPPDPVIYSSSSPFPTQIAEIVEYGFLMDYLIVTVKVCPFEYIPSSQQLSYYQSIDFTINYTIGAAPFPLSNSISENRKIMVQNLIKSFVANPADVVTVSGGVNNVPTDGSAGNFSLGNNYPFNIYNVVPDYIIITTNALKDSFHDFVDWKTKKGVPTLLVTLENDILGKYPGNDTADQIRGFTKKMMEQYSPGLFFLIGGDVNIIPARTAKIGPESGPSDLYYSTKDNIPAGNLLNFNWNANHNAKFGENDDHVDDFADAILGRLPVRTSQEVLDYTAKMLNYENLEYKNGNQIVKINTGFLTRLLALIGYDCDEHNGWVKPVNRVLKNTVYVPSYIHCDSLYSKGYTEDLTRSGAIEHLNNQSPDGYNLVIHIDHSGPYTMGMGVVEHGDMMFIHDVDGLDNHYQYHIMISYGCSNNRFTLPSISKSFMTDANRGCIAYIGSTISYGMSAENSLREFCKNTYMEKGFSENHIGIAFKKAFLLDHQFGTSTDRRRFNLLGDPEAPLWGATPATITASSALTSLVTGTNSLPITITGLPANINARICISKENEVYIVETFPANGNSITINNVKPKSAGTIKVMVTAKNCYPAEFEIPVTENPTSANLYVSGVEVLDNLPSQPGNGNGMADAGEIFQLKPFLTNSGQVSSSDMQISLNQLIPMNNFIIINNQPQVYAIPSNGTGSTEYPHFEINIENLPSKRTQYFKLNMPSSSPTWIDNFPLDIYAPKISLSFFKILDQNNSSVINPNDVIRLYVTLKNSENGIANDVTATITSICPNLICDMSNRDRSFGDILPYSNKTNENPYTLTVSSNWDGQTDLTFTLRVGTLLNTDLIDIPIILNSPSDNIQIEGFSSTQHNITMWWNTSANNPRYNVYRSNDEVDGYERINQEIIEGFSGYTDFDLPELTCYYYKVCCVSASGVEGPLSSATKLCTSLPYYTGWPVTNVPADMGLYPYGSPITEDVNNDMKKEIFLTIGEGAEDKSKNGGILAFKVTGEEYLESDHNPTYSGGFYRFNNSSCTSTPAIADVNEDGIKEVIVSTLHGESGVGGDGMRTIALSTVNTYEITGGTLPETEWSSQTSRNYRGPVLCGHEDGVIDQVAVKGDFGSPFFLLNSATGANASANWPIDYPGYFLTSKAFPVIADINSDNSTEYIIGINSTYPENGNSAYGAVYVWKNDGTALLSGIPNNGFFTGHFYSHQTNGRYDRMDGPPVVADINGDGKQEIILVAVEDPVKIPDPAIGHVICLQYNSNPPSVSLLNNWGYNPTGSNTIDVDPVFPPAVTVANAIPESGSDPAAPEIFVAGKNKLYGWNKNGENLPNFPITVDGLGENGTSPLIADIDGDQVCDVIVVAQPDNELLRGLYAFDIATGSLKPGWPICCGRVIATPCIDDVDFDGKNELIAATLDGYVHMWKTEGKANQVIWGKYRLNNYNNAVYSEPCSYSETALEITENTIWYQDVTAHSNIVIDPGASLTIKGTLSMPSEAKIIVKAGDVGGDIGGGQLIIDGGKITTSCKNLWKGVEVRGIPDIVQSTRTRSGDLIQGQVKIINSGAILNAEIGILAPQFLTDQINQANGCAGGIIYTDSAFFINNKVAVQFEPYEKTDFSTFQRTNFLTTGELLDGSTAQDAFVKMDGVSTIVFRGCTFKHQWRESEPSYTDRGTGIYSENSGFKIDIVCLDNADPCTNPRNSVFENLTRGIYAMNSGKSYGILMWNTLFIDNYEGAYLSGFTGTSNVCIYSSKFKNGVPTLWSYGLYLNECSEYQIENNEFYEEAVIPSTIGLIVNNSGTANNEIYRNTFHNLRIATLSQNANRNYEPPLHLGGLCYKCNKFVKDETLAEPNLYDLAITYDDALSNNSGIAKNQGTYLSGTSFSPAGNMFQPSPVSTHFDIFNEANQIDYYYHSYTLLPYKLRPENNYGPVTAISVSEYFTENSCPSTLPGGSNVEDVNTLMEAQDQSDSLEETLTTMVDGGSTSLLTFEVATSTTPEAMQIRSELLAESPYLSDTVMKTSVEKEEVLDNAMIRDILVANPHSAKSYEIINRLGERTLPMPDYMMEQILAGEDTVSTKEILEAKKTWWDNKASKSYVHLLNRFKGDSVTPANEDSLNWVFAYRNKLSSWYDKVGWLHAQGEFPEAENVLNSIPGIFTLTPAQLETHHAYLDFYSLSKQIFTDTTGNIELDSAVVSSLQNMAASNTDLPGTYARNLLISHGYLSYQEPIILPDAGLKDTRKEKFKGVKVVNNNSMLSVYPNPANDYFVIKIDLGKTGDQGILTLRDGTGRLIRSHPFYGQQDQLVWSTSELKSGMYLLSLMISGKQSDCVKITVVK